jgi:hypothetical protein
MRRRHSRETRERCQFLVETTQRSNEDIAAETDTSESTVRRWTRVFGWKRPEGPAPGRRKIPPDKYPAVRRLFACGADTADIGLLARCSVSQLNRIAAQEGWRRGDTPANPPPAKRELSEALAAVEAGLRQPDLAHPQLVRLLDRALALTAAESLAGTPGLEQTAQTLVRIAGTVAKNKPVPASPMPPGRFHGDEPADFPDANELIEEIARRFEEFCALEDAGAFSEPDRLPGTATGAPVIDPLPPMRCSD